MTARCAGKYGAFREMEIKEGKWIMADRILKYPPLTLAHHLSMMGFMNMVSPHDYVRIDGTLDLEKWLYLWWCWPIQMSPFWDWIGLERFELLQGTDAQEIRCCWFWKCRGMWQEVWAASIKWEWPLTADQKGHGDLRPTTLRKWIHPTTWMSLELYIYIIYIYIIYIIKIQYIYCFIYK